MMLLFLHMTLLPAGTLLLVAGARAADRAKGPFCHKCGYELTGLGATADTLCPECGSPRELMEQHHSQSRRIQCLVGLGIAVLSLPVLADLAILGLALVFILSS